MSKHTPGPWFVWQGHSEVYAGYATENTPGFLSGPTGMVALCDGDNLYDVPDCKHLDRFELKEQAKANARLIAAAPEMLGALKLAWAHLDGLNPRHTEAFNAVRDAIAKAEGPTL